RLAVNRVVPPFFGSHPAAVADAGVDRREVATAPAMTMAFSMSISMALSRAHRLNPALGIESLRSLGAGGTFQLGGAALGRRSAAVGTCDSWPLSAAPSGACAFADIVLIEFVAVLADDLDTNIAVRLEAVCADQRADPS